MPAGYKRLKRKEMGVPNRGRMPQIQCPERDSGGEERGKGVEERVKAGRSSGVSWIWRGLGTWAGPRNGSGCAAAELQGSEKFRQLNSYDHRRRDRSRVAGGAAGHS